MLKAVVSGPLAALLLPTQVLLQPTTATPRSTKIRAVATFDNAPASLSGKLPDCPQTKWDADDIDIEKWQQAYKKEDLPACPLEIHATPEANEAGKAYFQEKREDFAKLLEKHGTIWFRGFDLMKDEAGFRQFWQALDLDPCLDPLHTSGLRKFLSKSDGLYEEVNKESLSKHYIGLHNESTFKKTAKQGAFVCFKPATVSGGEFFIADGERIFRDLDPEILKTLYERKVRISVSNLDLGAIVDNVPDSVRNGAKDTLCDIVDSTITPKFDMDLEMVWGADGNPGRLQAIQNAQSPITRHPETGRPLWFCNLHNQARFLRDRRPCGTPEVGMTDIYYGDLGIIPGDVLRHVNEVSERNMMSIPMQPGEVLLIDNYRVLHGRDIFEGDRLHAVEWFGGQPLEEGSSSDKPGDILNTIINSAF